VAFNILVHKLPKPNWWLLRALSAFLLLIINHAAENKMTVRNGRILNSIIEYVLMAIVGIVFSPTLNIPAPVFSMFLTDFDAIFGVDPDESLPSPIDASPTAEMTPEDIRSPRRQMFQELPTPSFNQSSFPGLPSSGLPSSPRSLPTANPPEPRSPYNTGFIPMHPSYQQPGQKNPYVHQVSQINDPSHDFTSLNGALSPMPSSGNAILKAKRRESSMLTMDFGGGRRQSSMQQLKDNQGAKDPALSRDYH
jgi:RalA-binding protein 1